MRTRIEEAARQVAAGEIVAYATETFYGLAVDPFNTKAVDSLLALKTRDCAAGIGLVSDSADILDRLIETSVESSAIKSLVTAYWPGPLSLIIQPKNSVVDRLASGIAAGDGSIAVRCSSSSLSRELAAASGGLITAPSANPAGKAPARNATEVRNYFPELFVLEGEPSEEKAKPSTYLDIRSLPFRIVREAAISRESLVETLGSSDLLLPSS